MKAAEVRQRFLDYFEERGHEVRPSGPLVPRHDPTLLFTNAGMVQFKKVFLGVEDLPYERAATAQKCVRAGGKHNDLEQVGKTARHHTFFEMLGNFSFGDYFKREAIGYAWELLTDELGLDPDRLFVTVHHTDDEAESLWKEVARVPGERIYRLGDKDNFWQMADTGPCGPCSELHYDLREPGELGTILPTAEFEKAGDRGDFLELWNLVFMQFDRDEGGELHPLPAPSIDTGVGLERLAAVLQGVDSNYHTDLFLPLLDRVAEVVGNPYEADTPDGVGYRVLADHARATAFLLADGVFPSSEGRGYVLRRILRRGVRHAWLLGRRAPTVVDVVDAVVDEMADAYPELEARREHLLTTTRAEEERFLATVEGGMTRFEELAPVPGDGDEVRDERVIPGEEAFKLYDTYGFPLDLTELMAEERGYAVDRTGFDEALEAQRARSRADRADQREREGGDEAREGWTILSDGPQEFVGYDRRAAATEVLAVRPENGRLGIQLRDNPFYAEAGGQVSDRGRIVGDGWAVDVEDVRRVGERVAVFGPVEGELPGGEDGGGEPDGLDADEPLRVRAEVEPDTRHDTERNHTATHLLHAALREVLGDHVVQRGSLVAPERLRFDFAHTAPMTEDEIADVEGRVNEAVWADLPVRTDRMEYEEALEEGAMALFGEKYGDRVRVVRVEDVSMELCGGTHVRHTGEIGLFRLVSESGVAAGVRRVEAVTGPAAYRYLREQEEQLERVARILKTDRDNLPARIRQLREERDELESLLADLRKEGGAGEEVLVEEEVSVGDGETALFRGVRLRARDADDVRAWGDGFVDTVQTGVAVVAASLPEGKHALFTFVTDDLIGRGIRADTVVRAVAERVGGRGGGRPHMAQAGVEEPEKLDEALKAGPAILADHARVDWA
ncbi:MAG: alanine--tRNA ligase [Gemmatimonadota bacterium]